MKPMIKTQKARLYALLDSEEEIARAALKRALDTPGNRRSGAAHDSNERDYVAQVASYALEIERIAQARSRLSARTYGVCSECHSDIKFGRLLAYPTTLWCDKCQSMFDQLHEPRQHQPARDHGTRM